MSILSTWSSELIVLTSDSPGYRHFDLSSLHFACVTAPNGSVGLGGAAGGVNVPISCTLRATGTTTSGSTVETDLVTGTRPQAAILPIPTQLHEFEECQLRAGHYLNRQWHCRCRC